jgi:predicted NUDIX family phosphoesterase
MIAQERVWTVPRTELFPDGAPHGFFRADAALFERIYARGAFEERARVEEDPTRKQIIPYAVVVRGDAVFSFRRTDRGGERRLHGKRSIGVGGHVNPVDSGDVVQDALRRELEEELRLPGAWRARIVGLLNDDSTPVGRVHLGVVAVVDPGPGEVSVREADTMTGAFVGRAELRALHVRERATFEGWSALLLDRLDEVISCPRPHDSSSRTPSATRTSTT